VVPVGSRRAICAAFLRVLCSQLIGSCTALACCPRLDRTTKEHTVPKKFQLILDAILNQHPGLHDPVALIRGRRVFADGTPVTNPAARVAADATITVRSPRPLRGTLKLQAALAIFDCTIAGRVALDIGASTGGFTVALLEAGARNVYALDAGHGQLLGSLRQDPRVTNLERTNLADLGADRIPEPVEVVTIDLSYLSIADAIPQLGVLTLGRDAELIALVKPMFELHLARPPRDPKQFADAVDRAASELAAHNWRVVDRLESPIRGRSGAIEFFVHAIRQMARPHP
jgi:23S rRNA (cytidine1920-2'-O)/16S rRNA (cytidine1409-2'-O)-methyltransferase